MSSTPARAWEGVGVASNLPTVSVIVVNYRTAEHTLTCLRALRTELAYPAEKLRLLCVDNASADGSAAAIAAEEPGVELIESTENLGFAGGCNLGAKHASGEILAFINSDARPEKNWVNAAISTFREHPNVGAVASKVLDWDGEKIDFVDAGLTWFGMGYSRDSGQRYDESDDVGKDVLFGTGSALFVRASLFAELGGFDERFFMFYEDVDLGWRMNLRGWRVRYVPDSVVYHRHHASMSTVDDARKSSETYLLERNALATLYKNLSDETLAKVLPAALALTIRRATARGDIDPKQLEITRRSNSTEDISISRESLAGILAVDQFVDLLPGLEQSRKIEQSARRKTDADLLPLMRKAMEPAYPLQRYLNAHDILTEVFDIAKIFGRPRKILVLTSDALTERMAGPAIRAWHIALALCVEHDVRLITVNPVCTPPAATFDVHAAKQRDLPSHVDWADLVVLQGHALEMIPRLKARDSNTIVVCDLYDPMHLELLEQGKDGSDERRESDLAGVTAVLNAQLERGDFFLCASSRQRHFWLGHLAALGRITPELYDADPSMRSLIAEVPFGMSGTPPRRTGAGPREKFDGISDDDKVIIWAGGVYSWFDPLTLIRAVNVLRDQCPDIRLVFLGMRHPNPEVPDMDIAEETRKLASELGLTNKHVFFNEDWVPFDQRQNWLLSADCGVTTHFEHIETTFAFRTRVLDYLWAGLPIVTTDGDSFADLVREQRLGVVVPPEDPAALADALLRVLRDADFAAECRRNIEKVSPRFTWDAVLEPLVRFCRNPHPAADRLPGIGPLTRVEPLSKKDAIRRDIALFNEYLAAGGIREVTRRAMSRLRKIAAHNGGKTRHNNSRTDAAGRR
ncbi:MAG: glycosyltransferase [Sciscionella sp.]|nr:glycosyltransferase [Sciscionella sp.]